MANRLGQAATLVTLVGLLATGCEHGGPEACDHTGTSEPAPVGESRQVTLRDRHTIDFAGLVWATATPLPEEAAPGRDVFGLATLVQERPDSDAAAVGVEHLQRVDVVLPDGSTIQYRLLGCM
jgi:hypothetical protein